MAKYTQTYHGTGITGTSTTATVFKKSGVKDAKYGQTYINTANGHCYRCTYGGNPDRAKWKYTGTQVLRKPTVPVKSLALAREKGSRKMVASWKVQSGSIDKKSWSRASGLDVKWELDTSATKKTNDIVDKNGTVGISVDEASENLSRFEKNGGGKTKVYTRDDFYPMTGTKLYGVAVTVNPVNSIGAGATKADKKKGVKQISRTAKFAFEAPAAPSLTDPSFDVNTGEVSCTCASEAGDGKKERYRTRYRVTVTDLSKSGSERTKVRGSGDGAFTGSSKTLVYDAKNYQGLAKDQYIYVKFEAWNQGFAGDSKTVSKGYYLSFPKPISVNAKNITVTSRDSSGKVVVPVTVSKSDQYPVDYVKLQKLVNVEYASAGSIPGDAAWSDAGAVDNGDCSRLVASVPDLMPDDGNHTWLRVKAWHANEDALFSYSNIVEAPLFTKAATAADNKCSIVALTAGGDGESLACTVGWDSRSVTGDEDSTGVELSWSDFDGAWTSTKEPSRFEVDWKDSPTASAASAEWRSSATVSIVGLDEGTVYHVRARCYTDDSNGKRTYGPYSNTASCATASTPPSAVVVAPPGVAEGDGVPCSWVLSSAAAQTSWAVFGYVYARAKGAKPVSGVTYYTRSGSGTAASPYAYSAVASPSTSEIGSYYTREEVVYESGEGAAGACTIRAGRVAEYAENGVLTFRVRCYTGGGSVDSDAATVRVSSYPSLLLSTAALAAQPFSFVAETDKPGVSLAYTVAAGAGGVSGAPEAGLDDQPEGEVVDSASTVPAWEAVEWDDSAEHANRASALESAQAARTEAQAALAALQDGDDGYAEAQAALAAADAAVSAAQAALADGGTRYRATVTLDAGLPFYDGGHYAVTATATDPTSELSSQPASASFSVNWAHQAAKPYAGGYAATSDAEADPDKTYFAVDPETGEFEPVDDPSEEMSDYYEPTPSISVAPEVALGADGTVRRRCTLTLVPPPSAAEADVYDVYRVTHDGADRVGSGLAMSSTVVDEFAPFGDAGDYAYRVVTRTADGDVEWADFGYALEGECLRFDYETHAVELPYDLSISDSFKKDVEVRTHLSGDAEAYYGPGVARTASLSTSVLRIEDAETAARVREMAQRRGTVFVRTPDGSAYEADVQVKSLDVGRGVLAASFEARQVSTSEAFMLPRAGTSTS